MRVQELEKVHNQISEHEKTITDLKQAAVVSLSHPGAVLIKKNESEIDIELKDFFSHCLSKAYNIGHTCGL